MISEIQESNANQAMLPLSDRLFQTVFGSTTDALEFCREACGELGFTIKQETSANRDIHVYCSRKGINNSQNSPSFDTEHDQCECKWHIILTEHRPSGWKFKSASHPDALEHNHEMASPEDLNWPAEVKQKIIQLARQKMYTNEIRETIKSQFPDITWNDRRFNNYMMEEHNKIKQRNTIDKMQKLILISTQLCSVVAANEDWSNSVESDLIKMLDNFKQITRISTQTLNKMVDLRLDLIHSEPEKNRRPFRQESVEPTGLSKKRKAGASPFSSSLTTSNNNNSSYRSGTPMDIIHSSSSTKSNHSNALVLSEKGSLSVSIPSCKLYVRSQPLRSISEPFNHGRRAYIEYSPAYSNQQLAPLYHPSFNPPATPRIDINSTNYPFRLTNDILQSSPLPDPHSMVSSYPSEGNPSSSNNYSHLIYPLNPTYSNYSPTTHFNTQNEASDIDFSFETSSPYPHINPSSLSLVSNRQSNMNHERVVYHSPMDYYSPNMVRDTPPATINQRYVLHQEYEQQQRHLHSESSDHNEGHTVQLPHIRPMNNRHHSQHHPLLQMSHSSNTAVALSQHSDPTWSSFENDGR